MASGHQKNNKVYFLAGVLFVLVAAIFATAFLAQQRQQTRSKAQASTTLSLTPSSTTTFVGNTIALDVIIDPGANIPSNVVLDINFDATKLTPDTTPFTANKLQVAQGPVVSSGKILVNLTAGLDPSNFIQSPTKIGTVFLRTTAPTSTTQVSFGPQTEVLSQSPADGANENVLASSAPASIAISSSPCPIPTQGPPNPNIYPFTLTGPSEVPANSSQGLGYGWLMLSTPTATTQPVAVSMCVSGIPSNITAAHIHGPGAVGVNASALHTLSVAPQGQFMTTNVTLSQTEYQYLKSGQLYINVHSADFPNGEIRGQLPQEAGVTPTMTLTPTPTRTPTPLPPTPTTLPNTLSLTVSLHGIGSSGDSANPDATLSNKNPLRVSRDALIEYVNEQNVVVGQTTGTLTYSSQTGNYKGLLALPVLPAGDYIVKIVIDQHLKKALPGFYNLPLPTQVVANPVALVAGDMDNNNKINILDFNMLMDCYSELSGPRACTPEKKTQTDLNDDGYVNSYDYSLFLRDHTVQFGD